MDVRSRARMIDQQVILAGQKVPVIKKPRAPLRRQRGLIDYSKAGKPRWPRLVSVANRPASSNHKRGLPSTLTTLLQKSLSIRDLNSEPQEEEVVTFCLRRSGFRRRDEKKEDSDRHNYKVVYNKETGKHDVVEKPKPEVSSPVRPIRRSSILLRSNSFDEDMIRSCHSPSSVADLASISFHMPTRRGGKRIDSLLSASEHVGNSNPLVRSSVHARTTGASGRKIKTLRVPIRSLSDQDGLLLIAHMHEELSSVSKRAERERRKKSSRPQATLERQGSLKRIHDELRKKEIKPRPVLIKSEVHPLIQQRNQMKEEQQLRKVPSFRNLKTSTADGAPKKPSHTSQLNSAARRCKGSRVAAMIQRLGFE